MKEDQKPVSTEAAFTDPLTMLLHEPEREPNLLQITENSGTNDNVAQNTLNAQSDTSKAFVNHSNTFNNGIHSYGNENKPATPDLPKPTPVSSFFFIWS